MREEAPRDSHILMLYRGAPESRERALTSAQTATEDFLRQFEGRGLTGVALTIIHTAARALEGEASSTSAADYAKDIASAETLRDLSESVAEIRWAAGVAGTAEYLFDQTDNNS